VAWKPLRHPTGEAEGGVSSGALAHTPAMGPLFYPNRCRGSYATMQQLTQFIIFQYVSYMEVCRGGLFWRFAFKVLRTPYNRSEPQQWPTCPFGIKPHAHAQTPPLLVFASFHPARRGDGLQTQAATASRRLLSNALERMGVE
jgi:hypothetical protein